MFKLYSKTNLSNIECNYCYGTDYERLSHIKETLELVGKECVQLDTLHDTNEISTTTACIDDANFGLMITVCRRGNDIDTAYYPLVYTNDIPPHVMLHLDFANRFTLNCRFLVKVDKTCESVASIVDRVKKLMDLYHQILPDVDNIKEIMLEELKLIQASVNS